MVSSQVISQNLDKLFLKFRKILAYYRRELVYYAGSKKSKRKRLALWKNLKNSFAGALDQKLTFEFFPKSCFLCWIKEKLNELAQLASNKIEF